MNPRGPSLLSMGQLDHFINCSYNFPLKNTLEKALFRGTSNLITTNDTQDFQTSTMRKTFREANTCRDSGQNGRLQWNGRENNSESEREREIVFRLKR